MAEQVQEITIERRAEVVWETVGDFGGLAAWLPGIESCVVDGDVRNLSMAGMQMREQLVERDAAARRLAYSLVDAPVPIATHRATLTVHEAGDGSRVTWHVVVEPDELLPVFSSVYADGLTALKAHAESSA